MEEDFQKTVDLKKNRQNISIHNSENQSQKKVKYSKESSGAHAENERYIFRNSKKAETIDQFYNDKNSSDNDFKKFNRPKINLASDTFYKQAIIALSIFLIATLAYILFLKTNNVDIQAEDETKDFVWSAVRLVNNEVYYGQINDIEKDPIIIKNVYYDYDQASKDDGDKSETSKTGNLRLVKRGSETHGPNGTMYVIRSQVLYMEPLKQDSKVLKAILDYEQ